VDDPDFQVKSKGRLISVNKNITDNRNYRSSPIARTFQRGWINLLIDLVFKPDVKIVNAQLKS
jgi:hypothetical protein